ncbi:MAG TPA: response regulator [Salinimicrobium sp.]|nr:response regulator [Salinimicrobium sp.]
MITIPLRILLVEDNETDALLIKRQLRKLVQNCEIEVVEDLEACKYQLVNFIPDLVISDFNLPTCTGMEVLRLSQEIDPNLPLIFITGTIEDEELAANTILAGASGYILKKNIRELDKRLKPMLKKVVLQMSSREEVRERIRLNKASVNQIRHYLDSLNSTDIQERQENISRIRRDLEQLKFGKEE